MPSSLRYHIFNNFRKTDRQLLSYFNERVVPLSIGYHPVGNRHIRYISSGLQDKPLLFFVHGAPGSLDVFAEYLADSDLLRHFCMVSVDRPGFGYSGFGRSVVSLAEQSAMLRPLLGLSSHPARPVLVGHSYGGSIIARMAMDFPERAGALLMLAPALDPALEKVYWFSYPADWKVFRCLLPKVWQVTNDEKLAHRAELEEMLPLWEKIAVPLTVIQGLKDKIVDPGNAVFAEKQIKRREVKIMYHPRLNHMIPWDGKGLVKKAILSFTGN
jgi:pimeloyl-ACP methyl ester carboxylesterase